MKPKQLSDGKLQNIWKQEYLRSIRKDTFKTPWEAE